MCVDLFFFGYLFYIFNLYIFYTLVCTLKVLFQVSLHEQKKKKKEKKANWYCVISFLGICIRSLSDLFMQLSVLSPRAGTDLTNITTIQYMPTASTHQITCSEDLGFFSSFFFLSIFYSILCCLIGDFFSSTIILPSLFK